MKPARRNNAFGNYGGYSPLQWQLRRQHPLTATKDVPPGSGDQDDPFVRHVQRRYDAARAFLEAEAKTILRLARAARDRQLKGHSTRRRCLLLARRQVERRKR